MNFLDWFKGFKLKMLLLIMTPSAFLIFLIVLSLYVMREVSTSAKQVTDVRVPSIEGLEQMDEGRNKVKFVFYETFLNISKIDKSVVRVQINEALSRYQSGWDLYAPLEQTKEESIEWSRYVPLSKSWELKIQQILSQIENSDVEGARRTFEGEYNEVTAEANIPFVNILNINYEIVKKERENFSETTKNSINLSFILGITGIIGTILIGTIIAKRVSTDLSYVTDSISNNSSQVSQASQNLSSSAESLSTAAQELASTIEETSSSISSLVSVVKASADIADNTNAVAVEMQSLSQETTQFMENLIHAMEDILESNSRIEKLVKIIEEIGVKTEIIDDIVFKTQLLSFNASVEAERAGEQGRGFAVVAQEVGNLAQMSGKAAAEISNIVKDSIAEAGSVSQDNKERVQKGSSLVFDTKEKLLKVATLIQEVLNSTSTLSVSNKDQRQNLIEIDSAVENLSKATQETARNAEESSASSLELSGQSESLRGLVVKLEGILYGMDHSNFTSHTLALEQNHKTKEQVISHKSSWKKSA